MTQNSPTVFYVEVLRSLDKGYRHFLTNLKRHLVSNGYKDINSTQALIIYYIGSRSIKATELVSQEFYNGSNASYNIRQMVSFHYLNSLPSQDDGRVVFISLTMKGLEIYSFMMALFSKHQDQLALFGVHRECLDQLFTHSSRMIRFWKKDEVSQME